MGIMPRLRKVVRLVFNTSCLIVYEISCVGYINIHTHTHTHTITTLDTRTLIHAHTFPPYSKPHFSPSDRRLLEKRWDLERDFECCDVDRCCDDTEDTDRSIPARLKKTEARGAAGASHTRFWQEASRWAVKQGQDPPEIPSDAVQVRTCVCVCALVVCVVCVCVVL